MKVYDNYKDGSIFDVVSNYEIQQNDHWDQIHQSIASYIKTNINFIDTNDLLEENTGPLYNTHREYHPDYCLTKATNKQDQQET